MSANTPSCESRNACPGSIVNDRSEISFPAKTNLLSANVQIDYAGEDVSFNNLMSVLTGRHSEGTATSRRLLSDDESNILVFVTGHGGDGFFKFQDFEEITTRDITVALTEMHLKRRFNNLLFIADTCQASTLLSGVDTPGVTALSSSAEGENSFAYYSNDAIGVSVIDRFSFSLISFLRQLNFSRVNERGPTVRDMYSYFNKQFLHSTPVLVEDTTKGPGGPALNIRQFFEHTANVEVLQHDSSALGTGHARSRDTAAMFDVVEREGAVGGGTHTATMTDPTPGGVEQQCSCEDYAGLCGDTETRRLREQGHFHMLAKIVLVFLVLLFVLLITDHPLLVGT